MLVPGNGRVKTDLFNFATRDGAAHGYAVKHAGQNHVVDIARHSGDFVPAFFARHRGPNDLTDHHNFLCWPYSVLKWQEFQISIWRFSPPVTPPILSPLPLRHLSHHPIPTFPAPRPLF